MVGERLHVHFMGIMGSGCASIAKLAVEQGFIVSGCDQSCSSYYAEELKGLGIEIFEGHSVSHLTNDVDIVAVSPAIFDVNPDNEEVREADRRGILMTWQEFMGKYLQDGKCVIAVAGTHGKTTTTFLTAELLLDGGVDPTVVGGSVYKKWGCGARAGKSDVFLCEADEFNRNFFHYRPEIAVITNVEMDHPECFRSFEEVLDAFSYFLTKGSKLKYIVMSGDSPGAVEVLRRSIGDPEVRDAETYVIFETEAKPLPFPVTRLHEVVYRVTGRYADRTVFTITVDGKEAEFSVSIPGDYNAYNATAAVTAARILNVPDESLRRSLIQFSGAGRRFDHVGEFLGTPVFDDYAHHPTEIRSLLTMCRSYYSGRKVLAIFEPHQISRLTLMFDEYVDALTIADHVVIGKTHIGREIRRNVSPIPKDRWIASSDRIIYEEEPEAIRDYARSLVNAGECDMILVIGAANSYKLSRFLCEEVPE